MIELVFAMSTDAPWLTFAYCESWCICIVTALLAVVSDKMLIEMRIG